MKKAAALATLGMFAALAAGGAYYTAATHETKCLLSQPGGEMEWLRHEFQLSDAQFKQIEAAHVAYRPRCDALCARITNARSKISQLIAAGQGATPEMRTALADSAAVELDCREAMLDHIQTVSNYMDPASAARFRKMMEDRLIATSSRAQMLFEQ